MHWVVMLCTLNRYNVGANYTATKPETEGLGECHHTQAPGGDHDLRHAVEQGPQRIRRLHFISKKNVAERR